MREGETEAAGEGEKAREDAREGAPVCGEGVRGREGGENAGGGGVGPGRVRWRSRREGKGREIPRKSPHAVAVRRWRGRRRPRRSSIPFSQGGRRIPLPNPSNV